jgi:5-methylcytosine-specific restriction endonuclease McrBC regulatory subunit McrC
MKPKSLVEWLKEKEIEVKNEAKEEIEEHLPIASNITIEIFQELKDYFPFKTENIKVDPTKSLGLYLEVKENSTFTLKTYYYVGYWWVSEEEKIYVRVAPKKRGGKRINFVKVLKEILEDDYISGIVSKSMDSKDYSRRLFSFNFSSSPIPVDNDSEELTVFAILNFVYLLEKIVKKGLKKDYVRRTVELNSRVKGKLVVKETTKNFLRGTLTKPVCNFYEYKEDNLVNIILKTALVQIKNFILSSKGKFLQRIPELERKVAYLIWSFENVSFKAIKEKDFKKVRVSPFYPEYRKALSLAKIILQNLGFNPFSSMEDFSVCEVFPYFINMPLLFELYALKKIKERYGKNAVHYQPKFKCSKEGNFIPDFLVEVEDEITVIDAKYKEEPLKEDIQQLSLYGRLKDIRKENVEPGIILLMPSFGDNEKEINSNCFHKVKLWYIKIPLL